MSETAEDEHGEYELDAGSPHPVDPDNYDACNAVLRYTWSRYGERRYCTGMAVSNFIKNDTETSYEHPQFCKHHQSRAARMKHTKERYTTGAYAKSHEHKFQYMEPHEQLLANDLYKSLLDESVYSGEWDEQTVELEIDVADTEFVPDADTLVMEHPVPENRRIRAKALWHAALDFITMESIREEQFRVAMEESHDGRDLAVGEATTIVTVTDDGRPVEDVDEHHLNLPLSRIQKDYERHLQFGGVPTDDAESDDGAASGERDWALIEMPDEVADSVSEDGPVPEEKTSDTSPLESIEAPDGNSSGSEG